VPVANTAIGAGFQVSGTGAVSGMYKLSSTAYSTSTISLTGIPGTTYRLVFSWKSDGSDIANPPAAIDEVSLISRQPIAADAAPITFTATAITTNGMTVNWVDNSTNETAFKVFRSTDNITFTQIGANIASTSVAGTGTPYNSVQTALSAGTLYYYRIVAVLEAESLPLTGSQTTSSGATYYWTGATGGLWNTFSNWNTAADGSGTVPTAWAPSDTHIIDGAGTTAGGALSISVDRANFTVGQILITSNTNLTLASSVTTTRTITISGGPNEDFVLENGSTLNLINAGNPVAFAFSGTGNVGTIAGTYIASGSTSNTINTTGGTGTLITVTATGNITTNLNSITGGISGNATSLLFENGSNFTHSNSTNINYIPTATWQANATATLNGNTTGTTLTSGSLSLGNLIVNTTLSTGTLSAFTSGNRVIQGNLIVNSTGTGKFRALTNGVLTINGNLIINAGTFEAGSTGGGIVVKGTTTVASVAILDLGRAVLQNEGNMVNNGSVLSSETTTTNSTINFLGTTTPQTFSGTGTFTGRVSSFGVSNPSGLTISTPVLTQRVNLFTGAVTGASNITIGTGAALTGVVQIGTANNTNTGGSFDASPVFNLGTGAYVLLYSGETAARTTGFEVPSTRTVNTLILDNANGLTIAGGTIEVTAGLTLTNGIVTSTLANHIIHGSATVAGTLTGGSATSYINGPIVRTINDANAASNYVLFPVGKSGIYNPVAIAPTTTSVARFRAEAFDANAGTEDPSIIGLSSTRRFEALPISGTFTDINVRLSDAGIVSTNIPVQAPTATGAYASAFGSTATFAAGPPITVTSNFPTTSANYTGFLGIANSNACEGTPTPGATTTTANGLCLGQSTTLGITTIPVGSGVTYQWQSSADGISFTDITAANGVTFTVTPTASTFYRCNVTCATGPATGTSTAIQITFPNSVTATTPASSCGFGAVTLNATPSTGGTINWFAAATGGVALASGNSFTTPVISNTTSYYASAATSSNGTVTLGSGLTTSTSVGGTFLPGGWGGAKTQYIIKASELTAAGIGAGAISSLGFEPTTSGQTYQGFFVNIGHTTQNVATTTFVNSGLTFVYSGTLTDNGFTPVPNTINNLAFGTGTGTSSTFTWDGVSNIVVSISWSRVPSAATATGSSMRVDNVGFVSSSYDQSDNLTPAAMLAVTTGDGTSSFRPRFHLNSQVICSSPRVEVVATVTTPPALTLSATTATICEASATAAVTITTGATDYISYTWSPATAVSGNATTGWVFNPTETTNYTLTASQTPQNIIANGDFGNGLTGWTSFVQNPLAASFSAANNEANITGISTITGPGGQQGFIQLNQIFTPAQIASLEVGSSYKITFSARSSVNNRSLKVNFGENGGGFVALHNQVYSLSSTNANYETTVFTVVQTFGAMKLAFEMGLMNEDVFIDNVTLKKVIPIICNTTATVNVTVNPIPSPMTITPSPALVCVDAIQSLAVTGGTLNNISILNENFNAATNTWTRINNSTGGIVPNSEWTLRNSSYATSGPWSSNDSSQFYLSNSDSAGSGSTTNVSLVSPSFNTQNFTQASISFWHFYQHITNGSAKVQYSIDNGTTWVDIASYVSNVGLKTAFVNANLTLPAPALNQANVKLKFQYDASWGWFWAIDNVSISGTLPTSISWSPVTNLYTDAAATTAYVANTNASTVYFKSAAAAPASTYTATSTTGVGCIRTATVDVTVNPLPTVVTVAPTAICAPATINLTASTVTTGSDTGLTFTYFTDAAATTALTTPTAVTTSGTYYIKGTNANGCSSITSVVVVVNPLPTVVTVAPATVCTGTTVDLTANTVTTGSDTGLTFAYFTDAAATTALATPAAVTTSGTYYIQGTNANGCSTITSVIVTINITPVPTGNTAQTFCGTANMSQLVVSGTNIKWYNAANGGTEYPASLLSSIGLVNGNSYYASQTINGCESTRILVIATLTTTSTPTGDALQTVSAGIAADATIEDIVVFGTGIIWYPTSADALAGTNPIAAGTQLVTGNTYYAVSVVGTCRSTPLAVTITVVLNTNSFDIKTLNYFPNPVLDVFTVSYSKDITSIEVYDLSGRQVKGKKTNATEITLDMSDLAASVYVVKVFADNQSSEFRIVKK
jgi:hypothetical protein